MKDGILGIAMFFGLVLGVPLAVQAFIPEETSQSETAPTETLTAEASDYVANNGTSDCTSDCSGHDAGYEWAEAKDICDPEYDNGNSESFNEGVRAYAEDNCYYSDNGEPF
jgi:hypothetical protein